MIILLAPDVTPEAEERLRERIAALGLESRPLDHAKGRALEVLGEDRGKVLSLRRDPGVEEILTRRIPHEGGDPLWPTFFLRWMLVLLILLAGLLLLIAFFPPPLGDPAGSAAAGAAAATEWYLRPVSNFFRIFGEHTFTAGSLVLLFWLLFLFWPFAERADPATPLGRRAVLLARAMGLLLLVFLVVLTLS